MNWGEGARESGLAASALGLCRVGSVSGHREVRGVFVLSCGSGAILLPGPEWFYCTSINTFALPKGTCDGVCDVRRGVACWCGRSE